MDPTPSPSLSPDTAPAEFEHWRPVQTAAQWCDVAVSPGTLAHPETVWAALAYSDMAAQIGDPLHYYAIRIRLAGMQVAPASIMKPLIDGLASSLHSFADKIPELAIERLSTANEDRPDGRPPWLTDQRRAVLGPRQNLIRLTKKGIAFNPRDEDCVACIIEVADSNQPHLAGTVFNVEPR